MYEILEIILRSKYSAGQQSDSYWGSVCVVFCCVVFEEHTKFTPNIPLQQCVSLKETHKAMSGGEIIRMNTATYLEV